MKYGPWVLIGLRPTRRRLLELSLSAAFLGLHPLLFALLPTCVFLAIEYPVSWRIAKSS